MVLSRVCFVAFYLTILVTVTENKVATFARAEYKSKNALTRLALNKILNNLARLSEEKLNVLKKYKELDDFDKISRALRHARHRSVTEPPILAIVMSKYGNLETASLEQDNVRDNSEKSFNINKDDPNDYYENSDEAFYRNGLRNSIAIDENGIKRLGSSYTIREVENIDPENNKAKEYNIAKENDVSKVDNLDVENTKEHKGGLKNILRMWDKCTKEAIKVCKKACDKAFKDVCKDYRCSKSMKSALKKNCKINCKKYFKE